MLFYSNSSVSGKPVISQHVKRVNLEKEKTIIIDSNNYRNYEAEIQFLSGQFQLRKNISSQNLAYVIYTSGSSGKPKGTLITHSNVLSLFQATNPLFDFSEDDVWTLFHSLGFDFSVWEIWGALLYGGRLVIVPYWVSRSPIEFFRLLIKEKVTVLNQTPSAFKQLMAYLCDGDLNSKKNFNLRYIIFGGELLDITTLKPWFDKYSYKNPELVNMYGITETTVHVTHCVINETFLNHENKYSIGTPISTLKVWLLDDNYKEVNDGEIGEIAVTGYGVSRGYLGRQTLTATRFIPNLNNERLGDRLYLSGDLGRRLKNGNFEYLGRKDTQVKIRGHRVELGEIEAKIREMNLFSEVAVIYFDNTSEYEGLVAYVVPKDLKAINYDNIREFLNKELPAFMIPNAYIQLDKLPLTINGKLDKKNLIIPERIGFDYKRENYEKPQNWLEELIADIWKRLFLMEKISRDDDFFELGGQSLLAGKLIIELENELNIPIPIKLLFENPKLKEFTNAILENFMNLNDISKENITCN